MQRNFSFEPRDDEALPPNPQYNPYNNPPQQYLHPSSASPWDHNPQAHRNVSDASWHSYEPPLETASERGPSPVAHHGNPIGPQNTVIRKQVPPEAAAAAAARLAAVKEDLAPQRPPSGGGGGGGGYGLPPQQQYETNGPRSRTGTPTYPPSVSTPSSQAPLLSVPPPPQHQWGGTPQGSPGSGGRQRVLVDPLMGQYSDNPYKRMSTTWDPAVSQTGLDGVHDVLSDDDDDYGVGTRAAAKGAAAGGGSGLVGKKSSQPTLNSESGNLRGGAGVGVESGGLLVASGPSGGMSSPFTRTRGGEGGQGRARRSVLTSGREI